ncbi:hypothetical protein MY10362_009779 [Beauveria mimosiformis]
MAISVVKRRATLYYEMDFEEFERLRKRLEEEKLRKQVEQQRDEAKQQRDEAE